MTIKRRAISEAQKLERRQVILDQALELFRTTAYQEISIAAVAKKAGIAKGTVYLYFQTKEELFLALQAQQFEQWFDDIDQHLLNWQAAGQSCSIPDLVRVVARTLDRRPALTRLIAILHTILEQNIDLPAARQFKQMLRERVLGTGPRLEACLSFLQPGEGARLLLWVHALAIGVQHLAEPAPVVRQALAEPGLEIFKVDFKREFLAILTALLVGMEQSDQNRGGN